MFKPFIARLAFVGSIMLTLSIFAVGTAAAYQPKPNPSPVAVVTHVAAPIAAAVVAFPDPEMCDYLLLLAEDRCDSQYTCCMMPGPLCDPQACPPHPPHGPDPQCCADQLTRCQQLAMMHWMCCRGELPPEACALLPDS